MSEQEPPAVWWSPSLAARSGHAAALFYRDVHGMHDSDGVPVEDNLPADAVRLVPLVILPENFLTEHDADRFAAKMADYAGHDRETGADWAARPRRFSPEDTLSVAERLGAAEPSEDPDPNHVRNAVANVLLDAVRSAPPERPLQSCGRSGEGGRPAAAVTFSAHSDRATRAAGVIGTVGSCASTGPNRPTL